MPTYDYECRECGKVFEKFHAMSAKPRVKCPKCGAGCKKLIGTGAGVIFKGEGFYATDYRSKEYKKAQKKEADSAKSASSSKSDKAESKTAKDASDK